MRPEGTANKKGFAVGNETDEHCALRQSEEKLQKATGALVERAIHTNDILLAMKLKPYCSLFSRTSSDVTSAPDLSAKSKEST